MRLQTTLVLCALLAGSSLADPLTDFGAGVSLAGTGKKQVKLQADLDGDKKPDDIFLVKVKGKTPTTVRVLSPVGGQQPAKGEELALAVVLHPAGKPSRYLLRFPFYDSPTWKQGDYAGLVTIGQGPEPPKDAKGKSIGLFTESAAIYYFYWNGKTFVGSSEGDEP